MLPFLITQRRSVFLTIGLGAALLTAGCRKRETTVPPPDAAQPQAPGAAPAAAAPQSGFPPPAVVTTQASNDAAYVQEMTQTLNDFLSDYIREKKRIPKDINEMLSLRLITSIPMLPGGKKWVINQQTGKISAQ